MPSSPLRDPRGRPLTAEDLRKAVAKLTAERDAQATELNEMRAKCVALAGAQEQMSSLKAQVEEMRGERATEAAAAAEAAGSEATELREHMSRLRRQLDTAREEAGTARKAAATADAAREESVRSAAKVRAEQEAASAEREKEREAVRTVHADAIASMEAKLASAEHRRRTTQEELAALGIEKGNGDKAAAAAAAAASEAAEAAEAAGEEAKSM